MRSEPGGGLIDQIRDIVGIDNEPAPIDDKQVYTSWVEGMIKQVG